MNSQTPTKTRINYRNLTLITALAGALAAPVTPVVASDSGKDESAAVKREASEALDAIKSYSAEQRDQAVQELDDVLTRLDSRIAALKVRIDNKAADMKDDARANAESTMNELRQARDALGEKYEDLKDSSGDAWGRVKNAFAESYESVSQSLQRATEEF